MKKAIFLAVFIMLAPALLAQAVSLKDLGIESAGLLPSNPFYFFKEWRRGLSRALASDPARKAEVELDSWNERAAELKKLSEIHPQNQEAISRALDNYWVNFNRLQNQISLLRPAKLNLFLERAQKHLLMFDELKIDSRPLAGSIVKIPDWSNYLTGPVGELEALEILDRAQKDEPVLEEKLIQSFGEKMKNNQISPTTIKDLPGDPLRRLKILDTLRLRAPDPDLKSQLNVLRQKYLDLLGPANLIGETEARAAIESVKQFLEETDKNISAGTLERVKFHLEQAELLIGEGNFSAALSQANAASALIKQ